MDVDAATTDTAHDLDHERGHTSIDHDSHLDTGHHDAEEEHLTDISYIWIAAALALITALEVAASYLDLGWAFIPVLLILMAIKFFTVVSFFMHIRFDNKIFGRLFYAGLFLAVGVYIAALLTFQFFNG